MKVIRYSKTGFKAQNQVHHLKHMNYLINHFSLNDYPDFLQTFISESRQQKINFFKENEQDFQKGIWVFIDGYKNNQSLNHLREKVPCWQAEIPDDTICYSVNWDKKILISDSIAKGFGVYIPEKELSQIKNIKRA